MPEEGSNNAQREARKNDNDAHQKKSWTDGIVITSAGDKFDTDPFKKEFKLFRTRFPLKKELIAPDNPWAVRCDSWMEHVNAFACIKCGLPANYDFSAPPTKDLGDTRIKFLFDHLNILDTKFNIILTFNSLLLIAMNVLLGVLFNFISVRPNSARLLITNWWFWGFVICGGIFGGLWLLITIVCFFSLRRLVWGDLRRTSEKEHVKQLIIAVAKRTNAFRMAVPVTIINIFLLLGAFVADLILRWQLG